MLFRVPLWYTNFAVMEEQVKLGAFEKRIHEIDFIRGLLMVLVVVDHIFNLLMSFNKGWAWGCTNSTILRYLSSSPFLLDKSRENYRSLDMFRRLLLRQWYFMCFLEKQLETSGPNDWSLGNYPCWFSYTRRLQNYI